MEAVERIRANTGKAEPLRDSEEASGFSGLRKKKKKKKIVFFCASYGSRASEACLSVYSGLDSTVCYSACQARPSQQLLESLPRLSECGRG